MEKKSARELLKSTGEALHKWRQNAGLSQEDLAAILGVTRLTIINWERGSNTPRDLELLDRLFSYNEVIQRLLTADEQVAFLQQRAIGKDSGFQRTLAKWDATAQKQADFARTLGKQVTAHGLRAFTEQLSIQAVVEAELDLSKQVDLFVYAATEAQQSGAVPRITRDVQEAQESIEHATAAIRKQTALILTALALRQKPEGAEPQPSTPQAKARPKITRAQNNS